MAGLAPERISRFLTYILRHRPQDYPPTRDAFAEEKLPWLRRVES